MKSQIICLFALFCFLGCVSVESQRKEQQKKVLAEAEKEREIGKAAFAKLAGKYGVWKGEEVTAYLNQFGKSLSLYCERQEFPYFYAILDTEMVNAYSLPGGYILVTLGALKAVETPGELAGIICHELGHCNKRHITNNVKIETKFNFFEILARFIAGPRQIVTTMANQISEKIEERLFLEGFDAETEYEADEYARELLESLNINASDYVRYLNRLKEKSEKENMQELDRTHPDIGERTARLEERLDRNLRVLPVTPLFSEFLAEVQKIEKEKEK